MLSTKELLSLLENKTVYIDRVDNVQFIVLSNVRHQSDGQMNIDWSQIENQDITILVWVS